MKIKDMVRNKNNLIILLFAVVILMGIGFAAYSQRLQISETSNVTTNWNVYISDANVKEKSESVTANAIVTDRETATLTTKLKYPGDKAVYNITVRNDGSVDAILEKVAITRTTDDTVIIYSIDGISKGDSLLVNESKTFTVTVEYDSTKTGTATESQKNNTLKLDLDWIQKSGDIAIPSEETASDQLISNVIASGDGLYADSYEQGRYIYRGGNPNNYIAFNNETWRIMSVESDGTLKIIRNESIGDMEFDSVGARTTGYCASTGVDRNGCNAWAASNNLIKGDYYDETGSYKGVDKDSELNTYLNTTYYNSLSSESINKVHTHIFKVGKFNYTLDDLNVQINRENEMQWMGNIGLPSMSEYIIANSNIKECGLDPNYVNFPTCKTTNWIAGIIKEWTWFISPNDEYQMDVGGANIRGLNGASASSAAKIFPVLYLKSDIKLTGSGTELDKYIINEM